MRSKFTLIELITVLAIMMLTVSLAVVTFRGDSPRKILEQAARDFETFCARARYQAMEKSTDLMVALDTQSNTFCVVSPDIFGSDMAAYQLMQDYQVSTLRWKMPEKMEIDSSLLNDATMVTFGEYALLPLFRFFPDGGAAGIRNFILTSDKFSLKFSVSALSGRVLSEEGSGGDL